MKLTTLGNKKLYNTILGTWHDSCRIIIIILFARNVPTQEKMQKKNITIGGSTTETAKDTEKLFLPPLFHKDRQRLRREHRQAFDAGKIEAFVEILTRCFPKSDIAWHEYVFTEAEAKKYCFFELDHLVSKIHKLGSKLLVQQRLIEVLRQQNLFSSERDTARQNFPDAGGF